MIPQKLKPAEQKPSADADKIIAEVKSIAPGKAPKTGGAR
jgi:hypothetical protein